MDYRNDPFGKAQLPARFDRAGRIRLLAEFFEALLDNRMPSREAILFVAGGGKAWLQQGGSIERDFWRVSAPAGSHHTPAHVWRAMLQERSSQGAPSSDEVDSLSASSTEEEGAKRYDESID